MAKNTQSSRPDATARQAKIQAAAASSGTGGGTNKIVIAAVVAVIAIVAVVGGVVWSQLSAQKAIIGSGQEAPKGASLNAGYPAFQDAKLTPGAPTVEVYEDFQCPACQQFEGVLGSTLTDLAGKGEIKLVYNTLTFLDDRLRNDGSMKAGNGAYCAADAGKFQEFHDLAYLHQPSEGTGWTSEGLKALAAQAGLSGDALTTWQKCVDGGKYVNYLKSVEATAFGKDGIKSTPTYRINGTIVNNTDIATPDKLKAYLAKLTPSASPSS